MPRGWWRMLKRVRLAGLLLGALALVAGVSLVAADTPEKGSGNPYAGLSAEAQQALIDQAREQVSRPQSAYLEEFNSGKRSYTGLPIGEIDAFWVDQPLVEAAQQAERIVVARVESLRFVGSGMEDLPATIVTYRVLEVLKGSARTGERVVINLFGGPYREPNGKENFIVTTGVPIQQPGQEAVLFLLPVELGRYRVTSPSGFLQLAGGRVIADPANPESVRLEGRKLAEVKSEVAAALER